MITFLLYYTITWQFLLFIKTDLYFVISNILGCQNLYLDSWTYIVNKLRSVLKKQKKELNIPKKELKIVKIYAPLMFIATIFALGFFVFLGLPILSALLIEGLTLTISGFESNLALFTEGLTLTLVMSVQIIAFAYFVIKNIKKIKRK